MGKELKVSIDEYGDSYVKIPIEFDLTIYVDDDLVEKIKTYGKDEKHRETLLNKIVATVDRVELGEELLNNLK
jgi:hypothetical protein